MASSASRSVWFAAVPALAAALAAGCTVNPQPEPPLQPVDPRDVHVDRSAFGSVLILDEGSAPSDAVAWVFDLSSASCPPEVIEVGNRGGFQAEICAGSDHTLRIQLARAAEFTLPVDISLGASDEMPGLSACFEIDAAAHHDLGATPVGVPLETAIALTNDCPDPIAFTAIELRSTSPVFEVIEAPTVVAAGTAADVRVRFTPGSAEVFAEVLFLRLPGDPPARYSITLGGEGI